MRAMSSISTSGEYELQRFVDAQRDVYDRVVGELRRGRKTSHWMWFIFPQLAVLGRSATARHFGIASRDEALAYWRHPLLGRRLKECTALLLALERGSALDIFGEIDAMKLRSSMTLFEAVAPEQGGFAQVLQRFFDGQRDALTLAAL